MTELKEWGCVSLNDDVINHTDLQVTGMVYNDIRFDDGSYIITSRIISAHGRTVVTEMDQHTFWLVNLQNCGLNFVKRKDGLSILKHRLIKLTLNYDKSVHFHT